jgi:hypothetical protein
MEMSELDNDSLLNVYFNKIEAGLSSHLFLSWACRYQPLELIEYAKKYYPTVVEEQNFYNSGYWVLSKKQSDRYPNLYIEKWQDDLDDSSDVYFKVNPEMEFTTVFIINVEQYRDLEILNAELEFEGENIEGVVLVVDIKSENEENDFWMGKRLSVAAQESGVGKMFMTYRLPEQVPADAEIHIYVWNPEKRSLRIRNALLSSFEDSHYARQY